MDGRDDEGADLVVSTDPLTRRKAAAELRLEDALACIEQAQGVIDRACAELSSVVGMEKEWRQLGVLYGKVKASWHAVSRKGERLRAGGRLLLDRDPHADEQRQARGRQ